MKINSHDVKQLITINLFTLMIDHQDTITITIKGNAHAGPTRQHRLTQGGHIGGAHLGVDIETIRFSTDYPDRCTQLSKDAWSDFVSGTMGAIEDQVDAFETGASGYAALAKFDVTSGSVFYPRHLAQRRRVHHCHGSIYQPLNFKLQAIGQLASTGRKKLDTVVIERVV